MTHIKHLYKSTDNVVIAGVLGGLGEYADIDPTVLRLIFMVLLIITGFFPFGIAYIVAAILVPAKPKHTVREAEFKETN